LHIREYDEYYTIHNDKIDPREDWFGHLLLDAPEYLVSALSATSIGYKVGQGVYYRRKLVEKNKRTALRDAILAGCLAGYGAGVLSYIASRTIKKDRGK
jgi:hypothetical protein